MRSWKVRPYQLVLIASSRSESESPLPPALRKPPRSTVGFWTGSDASAWFGPSLPFELSFIDAVTYAADQILPAALHAASVLMFASSHARVSAVVML